VPVPGLKTTSTLRVGFRRDGGAGGVADAFAFDVEVVDLRAAVLDGQHARAGRDGL
jgi:hypothetical protein